MRQPKGVDHDHQPHPRTVASGHGRHPLHATAAAGLAFAGTADAQPNNGGSTSDEWDIGAYDFCMKNHPPLYTTQDVLDHHRWCCESTGGVWGSGDNGCHVPPAELSGPTVLFLTSGRPP